MDGGRRKRPSALFHSARAGQGGNGLYAEPVFTLAPALVRELECVLGSRFGVDGNVMGSAESGVLGPLEHIGDGVASVRHCVPLKRQRAGVVAGSEGRDRGGGRRRCVHLEFEHSRPIRSISRNVPSSQLELISAVRQQLRHSPIKVACKRRVAVHAAHIFVGIKIHEGVQHIPACRTGVLDPHLIAVHARLADADFRIGGVGPSDSGSAGGHSPARHAGKGWAAGHTRGI